MRKISIIGSKPVSEEFCVTTVSSKGGRHSYRREPCPECPWRTDVPTGVFPAEAFRHSARTAADMAESLFGCHMAGPETPQTCAGFLLRNAEHNLAVRIAIASGRIDPDKVRETAPLYDNYRAMAIANGVDENDPALVQCRGNTDPHPDQRLKRG